MDGHNGRPGWLDEVRYKVQEGTDGKREEIVHEERLRIMSEVAMRKLCL